MLTKIVVPAQYDPAVAASLMMEERSFNQLKRKQ